MLGYASVDIVKNHGITCKVESAKCFVMGSRFRIGKNVGSETDATESGDVFAGTKLLETGEGRLDEVNGIGGATSLGEDVVNTGGFEDCPDAVAGDYTGTWGSRDQDHAGRTEAAFHLMGDGSSLEVDLDHAAVAAFDSLLDGVGDFDAFGVAVPDASLLIADDDEGGEAEATATLDHAGTTADLNYFFRAIIVAGVIGHGGELPTMYVLRYSAMTG